MSSNSYVVRNGEPCSKRGAGFEIGLKLRYAISSCILQLMVRVEVGRVSVDGKGIWTVKVCGAQRNGRSVLNLRVEVRRGGKDAVGNGLVGERVAVILESVWIRCGMNTAYRMV